MRLASLVADAEVVFVSAAPLDPRFPGGFAPRHASFASAVAKRYRCDLVYVHDGNGAPFDRASCPRGIANVHVVDGSAWTGPDDLRVPRQSVARRIRFSSDRNGPLIITLTPSVAHVALGYNRSLAVLEEGWERILGRINPVELAEKLRYRSLYRRAGSAAAHVVAITPRESHHFARFMPADRVSVVPFGIDFNFFVPKVDVEQDIDVLVVGGVNRADQRVEELVRALQQYPISREFRCVILGGFPRPSIVGLADELVEVTGYVPDLRPYFGRAKVVAVPTFTDVGIKTTMLQAWAMGRPVVSSHAVLGATEGDFCQAALGVSTLVQMPPVIAMLVADKAVRDRCGSIARASVVQHHEIDRSAEQFAQLVDTVASQTMLDD